VAIALRPQICDVTSPYVLLEFTIANDCVAGDEVLILSLLIACIMQVLSSYFTNNQLC